MIGRRMVLALAAVGVTGNSWAFEQVAARITLVQSTYMPATIAFKADTGTPSCPAGQWLLWSNPNIDNNKATYALLLMALTAEKQVIYGVNNGDTGCTVAYVDILSN
jgi:hypothetical protein